VSITSKGKAWEWRHSLWMGWTFLTFGLFGWIAFMHIGIRVKQRKWVLWGFVYLVPFIVLTLPNPPAVLLNSLLVVGWIASTVHAFLVRREYLMRLEAIQQGKVYTGVAARQRTDAEYGTNAQTASPAQGASQPSSATSDQEPFRQAVSTVQAYGPTAPANTRPSIDLNSASEQELASLSGVGIIVAKRAVSLRESRGGFRSVEDFGETLNLKQHVVERIRPLVYASPPPQSGQSNASGRVVDF
jgi:DNA uptake protein ComE-like DNA-binding protein